MVKGFWSAFLLFNVFSSDCFAQFDYNQFLEELQEEFEDASPRHKILFMNRLHIDEALSQIEVHSKDNAETIESKEIQILKEYVLQKTGRSLENPAVDHLLGYFKTGSAVAIPVKNRNDDQRVCAVFTSGFGNDAERDAKRLIYWTEMKDHVHEYRERNLPVLMSETDFFELSVYHELFHCLDPVYAAKQDLGQRGYESQENFEKLEAFAEVGALLYLASHKNKKHLVEPRLLYRLVGSFMVGRYGDQLLGANPFTDIQFGVVYSFYPSLLETQLWINEHFTPGLDLKKLIETALDIVGRTAFSSEQSYAISRFHKDPENLQKLIEDFKEDSNELLRQRFQTVESYRNEYIEILNWALERIFEKPFQDEKFEPLMVNVGY